MTAIIIFAASILGAAWFALYLVATRQTLERLDETANNALTQIAAQLQSRRDAATALVNLVKEYSEREYKTLVEAFALRRGGGSVRPSAESLGEEAEAFGSFMRSFAAVAERYPDLKRGKLYKETMRSISDCEENARASRIIYNDAATKLNAMTRRRPSSFVASALRLKRREYLETT